MHRKLTTLAGLGIIVLAFLPAAVLAAPARAQTTIVEGTLTGIATGSITVTTPASAKVTIATTSHTHFAPYNRTDARAGFKTGEQVVVFAAQGKTGPVATTVEYSLTPFGVVTHVSGTITAAGANSLTLSTSATTNLAVTLTSKTRYSLDNRALKAVSAFPANEPASISGQLMTTGEIVARNVALDPAARGVHRVIFRGTIGTQGPSTLAITTHAHRTFQVSLGTGTLYVVDGTLGATAPTITSTEKVDIIATKGAGTSYTASSIWVKTH